MKYVKPAVYLDAVKFVYSAEGSKAIREFCEQFEMSVIDIIKERSPFARAKAMIERKQNLCRITIEEGDYLFVYDGTPGHMSAERFELTYQPVEK